MAFPAFIFTNKSKLNTIPIKDGQFIIVKDTEDIYIDMETDRKQINADDITGLSTSGKTITITKRNGSSTSITLNDATQSVSGLMSEVDKKKSDLDKPISFSLATSAWTSSSNNGYSYRASITNSDIAEADSANVVFDIASIAVCLTAQVAPSITTYDGGLYLYSKTKPTTTLSGVYFIKKA